MVEVTDLIGKTLVEINNDGYEIILKTEDGLTYRMYHYQDCCECVRVEEIIGELDDLIGSPITMAEEVSNADDPEDYDKENYDWSHTWTFYKFATVKGYVTIRWLGESNGYYGESVDFELVKKEERQ